MYTIEDGEQRVGFYSLEMAKDLEVEPKPYHVIALQDAGDCKSLCYIIQARLEMLGHGQAFVVAQPPKVLKSSVLMLMLRFINNFGIVFVGNYCRDWTENAVVSL